VVSQNRWWDMNLEGRHMIQNGDIGDTVEAEVEYLQDWMNWGCPAYWRTVKGVGGEDMELADGGIGKLLDIAQHAVDIVTWVAGMRIAKVENAFVRQNVMEREDPSGGGTFVQGSGEKAKVKVGPGTKFLGDDTIIVVATLANGATLKVTVTQTQAGHKNHLKWRFYGTKGSLEFDTDMAEILKHYGFGNRMEVINRSPGALASRDSMASWLQEGLRILNTKNAPFAWYTPDMHGQGWREVHRRGLLSFALYAQLRHHGILGAENRKDLFMVPTAEEAWAAMRAIKAMYLAAASGRSQDVTYDLTKELK
jgi:predicted dehydrogenase